MHRVLIVDDDPLMLDMCELALTKAGYSVTRAKDESEALAGITQKPDCLLLDLHLGNTLGLSIIEKTPAFARKTIVLTNDDNPEVIARVIGAGISDYVVKSGMNLNHLLTLVEKKIAL